MRRVGADRRRDSMPPERDSLDVFKPEPEGIVIPKIISRVKRKIKNGDFTSAKKNLGKILDAEPKNMYALVLLSKVYFKTGEIEKAEEVFCENKVTGNIFLYNVMITGHGKIKNRERAEEIFNEAVDKGIVDSYSYNIWIDMHCEELEIDTVRKLFHEAVEIGIANAYTYNRMIYCCARIVELELKEEIVEEARRVFDKAVEIGIANGYTYTAMMGVYSNIGDAKKGMEILEMAIRAGVDNPGTYKKALYACGNARDMRGVEEVCALADENRKLTLEVRGAFNKIEGIRRKASGGD